MSQPQAILDYASPGRAGRFRVGSQSVIRVFDRGDRVQIVENLENRGFAATLIFLDLCIIALMFLPERRDIERLWYRGDLRGSLVIAAVVAVVFLVILIFAVLHNWASTQLESDGEKLVVSFTNPVRRKSLEAHRSAIHSIEIETGGIGNTLELRILSSHYDLRLFTGHPHAELIRLQSVLRYSLQLKDVMDEIPYARAVE